MLSPFRPRNDAPQRKVLLQEEVQQRGKKLIIKKLERKMMNGKGNRKALKELFYLVC
jgi:hypothetical protein